jgi:hypothetical protein
MRPLRNFLNKEEYWFTFGRSPGSLFGDHFIADVDPGGSLFRDQMAHFLVDKISPAAFEAAHYEQLPLTLCP